MNTALALPSLDAPFRVAPDTVASYRRNGHAIVRGLAGAEEIAAYRPVISAAAHRANVEDRPLSERDTYGKAFLQMWGLWEQDEDVARFVFARRFAGVAAHLMGVDSVRIYHDQALFKEPGGGPTPMHQDQHYWPLGDAKATTMWMPLVPVSTAVGSMFFADGSHRLGYLGDSGISDDSARAIDRVVAERELSVVTHGAMAAGDATFHDGWTVHGAPANPGPDMREIMTVIFIDGAARVSDIAAHQTGDHAMWLPGTQPGDPAASPRNPLVYARA